jgi:ribosomal-protein-alanine N-acetyltransferase
MELDRIETEHLIGQRVQQDDLGLLYRMYTNEEVMYTLGGTRVFREAQEIHTRMMEHWEKFNFGIYIFRDKATGEFAGRGGLKKVNVEGKDEVELIYALMPPFWGKGLASEIARKSIEIASEHLKLNDIVSFTWTENKTSQRTMEKVGFKFEKNFTHHNLPHVLYRLQKTT